MVVMKKKILKLKRWDIILLLHFEGGYRSPINIFAARASANDSSLGRLLSLGPSVSGPKLACHLHSRQNVQTNDHVWDERVTS
jgi:hypothetical protein